MKLVLISFAWVAGIFLGSKINLPLALIFAGLCPVPFIFFFKRLWKPLVLLTACLTIFFGAAFYFPLSIPDDRQAASFNEQGKVELTGTVISQPEIGDTLTRFELSVDNINGQTVSGRVLVFTPRYPEFHYGDILLLKGELSSPPVFEGFDYQAYLARDGIFSVMLLPRIELLDRGAGSPFLSWVYNLRENLSESLVAALPEPQASLTQGIVLGIRTAIPDDLQSDLSVTGTAHLLAISGINLTIIAGILVSLGISLFGRRYYIYVWLALSMVWFYTLITGMQAPVLRAAVMASLFLFAELLGRQKNVFPALAFSAALMVGFNPQLLWSVSFQLSFLAMFGLVFISPILRDWFRKPFISRLNEESFVARTLTVIVDSFSVTLGAIIAVWPVIALNFGLFSFVAPLSTLLIAPVLSLIIFTGAAVAFAGLFSPSLAQVLGWIAWLPVSYMLWMVEAFAFLPAASIRTGPLHHGLVWTYYSVLGLIIFLKTGFKTLAGLLPGFLSGVHSSSSRLALALAAAPKKYLVSPLLLIAFLTSMAAVTLPDDNLHVSFLDVGEGDSTLIRFKGQNILIDGGPGAQAVCLGLSQKLPFWDRSLDLVILTHPHLDHLSGLVEVLKRYRVKQVLSPGLSVDSPAYREWSQIIRTRNIEHTLAQTGQQIILGDDAVLKVLNSPDITPVNEEAALENEGIVMRLNLGEVSFIFTGDIQQKAESDLINRRTDLSCTVLKVAHHGSSTSTSPAFLSIARPQFAVISAGAGNSFGHPSPEVLARLENTKVYRTDTCGTIEFTTDGHNLWVKTQRQ